MSEIAKLASLIAVMADAGPKLPAWVRARILSNPAYYVAPLIMVLDDHEIADDDSARPWAAVHAVDLLTELGVRVAIQPMLRALQRTGVGSVLHHRIISRIPSFGAAALYPVLIWAGLGRVHDRIGLHKVLMKLTVDDERVFASLCAFFEDDPFCAASLLGEYGDARALPLLARALEEFEPDLRVPAAVRAVVELDAAIRKLGGKLSPAVEPRVHACLLEWKKSMLLDAQRDHVFEEEPARSDPCRCGSGKSYAQCCLQ